MEYRGNVCLGRNVTAMHHRARYLRTMYLRARQLRSTHVRARHDMVTQVRSRLVIVRHVIIIYERVSNACNSLECKVNACLDRNVRARHHMARHLRTMNI
jgi:hypothetical protein